MKKSYNIIYEDEDIVVLDKSAHVLSIEDRYDPTRKNLRTMLTNRFEKIFVVHRLDMETSGVMVFAKNEIAHAHLSEQFQNRQVQKKYSAICKCPRESKGVIDISIGAHHSKKGIYTAAKDGKQALTEYEIIKSLGAYALVSLNIKTGRTHQIRVHMKHIGAPLLTDKKYGLHESFFLSQIKKIRLKKDDDERPLLSRTALHSSTLSFSHPTSTESLTFSAPLHKDMKAVIFQLEKYADKKGDRVY